MFSRAELTSLLIQIEGCLNSRPLVSLPSGPNGVEALTPAHFLIGCPVTALPIEDVPRTTSLRSRWRELQSTLSAFWRIWSAEYLNSMQQRPKLRTALRNIKVGEVVIIQEPTPPAFWRLGRVVGVRPGADGLVRVVQVWIAGGSVLERSIRSLVPLLESED